MRLARGFTLLEIIIAISLIAFFVTLPILAYSNYLKKTRDTQRKNSVNQIQSALEQYRANNGKYPPNETWKDVLVAQGYLPSIPVDPFDGQGVTDEAGVYYGFDYSASPDGQSYLLSARLEENERSSASAPANEKSYYTVGPEGPKVIHITPGGAGGGGSGSGTLPGGNLINGVFSGSGSGAINAGATITMTGSVSGGIFTGSYSGTVSGGPNGTVSGNYSGPVTGTIAGAVTGECTLTSGTVTGSIFNGAFSSCTLIPSSSGGLPTNSPIPTTSGIPTLTPTNTRTPTPTNTLTPTNTPTRTPTPTNTPTLTPTATRTPTPTFTPSPTPRMCWGIGGNCDPGCNSPGGGSGVSPVYGTCTGPSACWNTGAARCDSSNSANQFKENYQNSSNCTANYFGHIVQVSNACSANGTGSCYKYNGNFSVYTFSGSGIVYEKSFPGGACAFGYNYANGGGTMVYTPGTATTCSWSAAGICGVTLSNMTSASMKVYNISTAGCAANGTGSCSKYTVFGAGYDPSNNTTNCTSRTYYNSPPVTCTYYAN